MKQGQQIHVKDIPKVFFCPECTAQFDVPEELGTHLERHYDPVPVGQRRKTRGVCRRAPRYCPNGCGRFFAATVDQYDLKAHTSLCDGSAPIGIPQLVLIRKEERA